jgi:hypothetical protein
MKTKKIQIRILFFIFFLTLFVFSFFPFVSLPSSRPFSARIIPMTTSVDVGGQVFQLPRPIIEFMAFGDTPPITFFSART